MSFSFGVCFSHQRLIENQVRAKQAATGLEFNKLEQNIRIDEAILHYIIHDSFYSIYWIEIRATVCDFFLVCVERATDGD